MIDIVLGRHSPLNERLSVFRTSNYNSSNNYGAVSSQSATATSSLINRRQAVVNPSKRNDEDEDDLDSLPPLDDDDRAANQRRTRIDSKKLLDHLRGISYNMADTDEPQSGSIIKNSQAAFQSVPISSLFVDTRPLADELWLYNDQLGTRHHAYVKARASTAVTIYPLLVSRGIKNVDQFRRMSVDDVTFLRRSLCKDSAGIALFGAVLSRLQRDAVDPSCGDKVEVICASSLGSGCEVKCDLHHNVGIAQDRRPEDHSLRWHRKKHTDYTVVCKECAPSKYASDVQSRVEKSGQGLVCPQPPWVVAKKKSMTTTKTKNNELPVQLHQQLQPQREPTSSSSSRRLFEPRPDPRTGRLFVPRLTTLQQQLLPSTILPEESDEVTWNQQHHKQKKSKMHVGNSKALSDLLGLPGSGGLGDSLFDDAESYDPFRCRAAVTFTLDEIAATAKILKAVKEVVDNQYIRAGSKGPEPFVDAVTTVLPVSVVGQALASFGVDPRSLQAVAAAIGRGRLGSMAAFMSSTGNSGRRSVSGSTLLGRGSPNGRDRQEGSVGSSAALTARKRNDREISTSFSSMTRRRSSGFGGRKMSSLSATSGNDSPNRTAKRGVTVSDFATWIEQRLDAPKFLKAIFCRFSRSTPWIIFRHEIDEAIRSRVSGIEIILQMLNESNVDILPFERFAAEVSKGRISVAFTEQFLADAIRFIAEHGSGSGGGGRYGSGLLGSRKGSLASARRGGSSLRRAGSSTVSVRSAK